MIKFPPQIDKVASSNIMSTCFSSSSRHRHLRHQHIHKHTHTHTSKWRKEI